MKFAIAAFGTALVMATSVAAEVTPSDLFDAHTSNGAVATVSVDAISNSPAADFQVDGQRSVVIFSTQGSATTGNEVGVASR